MFNPCHIFSTELLEAMIGKQVMYYVRSTYHRGLSQNNTKIRGAYLISHYHKQAEAERHFNAITHDPHRFLYDARNAEHIEKLKLAAAQPRDYLIFFFFLIPGIEKKITAKFREHTKRYLYKNTNWDLKGRVTIVPFLYFQLGELYTRISHQGDEIRMTFEELENS